MEKLFALLIVCFFIAGCGQTNEVKNVNGYGLNSHENIESHESPQVKNTIGLKPGQIPPKLDLETLAGDAFSDATIKGKKVAINFWASWCDPCHMEMPDVVRFAEENQDDFIVVSINVAETLKEVEPFVKQYGIDFPVLLDTTGELSEQYQVLGLPTTFFLHSDGTIASKHVGVLTWAQLVHAHQNLN